MNVEEIEVSLLKHLFLVAFLGAHALYSANLLLEPETGKLRSTFVPANATVVQRGETVDFSLSGPCGNFSYSLPLSPESRYLILKMKMRSTDLVPGKAKWQGGSMAMRFHDKDGNAVGPWPKVFVVSGTTGLQQCERVYPVPEGAKTLRLKPVNFGLSGKVEFLEVRLEEVSSERIPHQDATLPEGMTREALFSLRDAWRLSTPTRERIYLNGLWEFRPELPGDPVGKIPETGSGWGYFKVPGSWPVTRNGMELILSDSVRKSLDLKQLNGGFYRREITVDPAWKGRRILLCADMVQTCAKIYVDKKEAGELYYPGGEVDLTGKLIPGRSHELVLLVRATPGENVVFMAPGRLVKTEGGLVNRGITGDLYLESRPEAAVIRDVLVLPSVRKSMIRFDVGLEALPAGTYRLEAEIAEHGRRVKTIRSELFPAKERNFRHTFQESWSNAKLWDLDSPENLYTVKLRLFSESGALLDEFLEEEFGFREFWTEGRFLFLNGSKLYLRALAARTPLAPLYASPEWIEHLVRESRRLGANFLIGLNYNFQPGVVSHLTSFHRETSRRGMLTALTLPHVRDFHLNMRDPATALAYRRQAEHLIRRLQNVPGVVMYAMNHNATGYAGDQNPARLGTGYKPEDVVFASAFDLRRNADIAARIARELDPSRPVYHHESGNLGDLFTLNCYLNWAPRQERSDWLECWEHSGRMPVFFVEWGLPHVASWSSYRGPAFIWRSAARQCLWVNEFNAAILGEKAYRADPAKKFLYDRQESMLKGNRPVFFSRLGANTFLNDIRDVHEVRNYFISKNFRDMRARGISGLLPWDQFLCWKQTGPGDRPRHNPRRFERLKQPGVVPDLFYSAGEAILNPLARFRETPTGAGIRSNFQDELGWIGGQVDEFTELGHNFRSGERVRKSLVLLNHSRKTKEVKWRWEVPALGLREEGTLPVAAGERHLLPLEFSIPETVSGPLEIRAELEFPGSKKRTDRFVIDVIQPRTVTLRSRVGCWDPEGSAMVLLKQLGVSAHPVKTAEDLNGIQLLIIGRNGLAGLPFPLAEPLRNGLKVLLLEQPSQEFARLGLRYTEQGFRELFSNGIRHFPDLHDWRGQATLLPPMLAVAAYETGSPQWDWNGFRNARVWRAGNRGALTEVLLEKPPVGNWLPLLQCGFDLQYSPLLLLSEGRGKMLFCQLAVSGRSTPDPEAEKVLGDALLYLDRARTGKVRKVFFLGDAVGAGYLTALKVPFKPWTPEETLDSDTLLVLASGARPGELTAALQNGCNVLALGLSRAELEEILPGGFRVETRRCYSDFVPALHDSPEFLGISNADLHWRGGMQMDAFPADAAGGCSLDRKRLGRGTIVAFQLPPWKFDEEEFYYRTCRRRSALLGARLLANLGAEFRTGFFSLFGEAAGNIRFQLPNDSWRGVEDPENSGRKQGFFRHDFQPDGSWRPVAVPGCFDNQFEELANYDGFFWYRLEFELPAAYAKFPAELSFGSVDDESWIWLNGRLLGEVSERTNPKDYWKVARSYALAPDWLKAGRNTIAVLCRDLRNKGGILGIPELKFPRAFHFYYDEPLADDDPYRYYRW